MGADYIHAILNGYTNQDDPQWNLYYPGPQDRDAAADHRRRGRLQGRDAADAADYATDIAAFLTWAAEPNLGERRRIGLGR